MKSLLLLLAVVFAEATVCPQYISDSKLAEGICVNRVVIAEPFSETFYLNPCKSNQFCNTSSSYPYKCANLAYAFPRLPGQYCNENKDCRNLKCGNGVCIGLKEDESCDNDANCDTGLFCKWTTIDSVTTKKCTIIPKRGENCPYNRCGSLSACLDNRCIKLGSLNIGENSNSPYLCKSLYTHNGKCQTGYKLLHPAKTDGPPICTDRCLYKDGASNSLDIPCQCGHSQTGKTYCPILEGDIDSSDV